MNQYNYLIVGSGLFGTTMAYLLHQKGYKCLVIDKRPHIGGNVYTESVNGINVHKYGAHIFHTSDRRVWEFVNSFVEFNRYTNSPVAKYKGKLYNLPFNMNTFYQMWGVTTPEKAKEMIEKQRKESGIINPQNLEEQAISLIGKDIYYTLIKDYTEKQWGRKSTELPAFMIERMLEGVEVRLDTDYFENREYFDSIADRVIYTGEIDRFFDYRFGHLEYRTVSFETELLEGVPNFQGNAVVNYTDADTPYTRIIEHKHFEFGQQPDTVISREYSKEWRPGDEPYYPVNDIRNSDLYARYKALADGQEKVIFGGRLAEYKYYDMHQVIASALELAEKLC